MNKNDLKKIMIIITLIDVVLLAIFFKVLTTNNVVINKNSSNVVKSKKSTVSETSQNNKRKKNRQITRIGNDYRETMDNNILSIFKKKIVGNWRVSQNMIFNFGDNGSYSGFFDNKLNNVSEYTYQCTTNKEGNQVLYIYNKEKTSYIMYNLKLNAANNIVLHFDAANVDIELTKEKQWK